MIRTAVLALAFGALAVPALAFESHSAPAPKVSADFTDTRALSGMMPATTSESFHFGPAEPRQFNPDQPETKKDTVIYDLSSGKTASRVDVTDPRDNPFMSLLGRSDSRSPDEAH